MMAWLEGLRTVKHPDGRTLIGASFRGVAFFVDSSNQSDGRRLDIKPFPFKDAPAIRDMGRRPVKFSLTGWVLGAEYLTQKAALDVALNGTAGPGPLVHPYHEDTLRVNCDTVSIVETRMRGGIATFSIVFVHNPLGSTTGPTEVVDPVSTIAASAEVSAAAVAEDIEVTYDAQAAAPFALESVAADVAGMGEQLGESLSVAVLAAGEELDDADIAIQELAALNNAISVIVDDAVSLVKDPADVLAAFLAALEAIEQTIETAPRLVLRALLAAYDVLPQPTAIGDTPQRELERENQVAMAGAVRTSLATGAATLLPRVPYVTLSEALEDRDAVIARIDEQRAIATDAVYGPLSQLRADVLLNVPGTAELARVNTTEQQTPISSLVLSHSLYGVSGPAADIVVRNPTAQHPGFLQGEIEVLTV